MIALSCTVCELFDVDNTVTLKYGLEVTHGHWNWYYSKACCGFLFAVTMAVSVGVCEIFSVKEWCDLENRVRVCSRSLEVAPFDRSHTSSYSPSIVTMAISCIVCEIYWLIGRKSRNFYTPPVFSAPAGGDPSNFVKMFDADKTGMIGGTVWWKKLWQYVKPFSSNTGT